MKFSEFKTLVDIIMWYHNFLPLLELMSFRNLLCSSVGSSFDCICLTFKRRFGVRHIRFLDRSFGAFLTMSIISVVVVFNVSFNVVFNILLLNETIRWRLFFPSTLSGKNIFPGLPRTISLPNLLTLNKMLSIQTLGNPSFFLLQ